MSQAGATQWPPLPPDPHAYRAQPQPYSDPDTRREVEAALAARRDLGREYEDQLAAGLAERVELLAAHRSAELRRLDQHGSAADRAEASSRTQRFVLGIVSLGAGVPITAIAAVNTTPGLAGVLAAWAGIVGVNAVFAWASRTRRP